MINKIWEWLRNNISVIKFLIGALIGASLFIGGKLTDRTLQAKTVETNKIVAEANKEINKAQSIIIDDHENRIENLERNKLDKASIISLRDTISNTNIHLMKVDVTISEFMNYQKRTNNDVMKTLNLILQHELDNQK